MKNLLQQLKNLRDSIKAEVYPPVIAAGEKKLFQQMKVGYLTDKINALEAAKTIEDAAKCFTREELGVFVDYFHCKNDFGSNYTSDCYELMKIKEKQ